MSDLVQEIADLPREFFKDGTQFINRCTKRTLLLNTGRKSQADGRALNLEVEESSFKLRTLLPSSALDLKVLKRFC